MRIILIALLISAASISTASAQFAMDHGRAEDAAKAAAAAAAAKAAAAAGATPASPSQPNNFVVNGDSDIEAAPHRTPEQQKADAEAQAAWQARCRPVVLEDREGMRRVRYAESDCDLSRFNTAGR
jgi:hypothetical protein